MPTAAYVTRLIVGRPLSSGRLESERLDKKTALAVLSPDASPRQWLPAMA